MNNQLSFQFFAPEVKGGAKIQPGIHEVNFTSAMYDKGTDATDIVFTDASGRQINKRVFHTAKIFGEQTLEEAISARNKKNLGVYYALVLALHGVEAVAKVPDGTYEQIARAVEAKLSFSKGKKVWLKVVRDKEGMYPEIPRYGEWIQSIDGPCTLSLSEKEAEAAKPSVKKDDDMPF